MLSMVKDPMEYLFNLEKVRMELLILERSVIVKSVIITLKIIVNIQEMSETGYISIINALIL